VIEQGYGKPGELVSSPAASLQPARRDQLPQIMQIPEA
jgi:hypothetical protein